ncbi:MAG: hypothetical protein DMF24_08895 [Verrucomicrobia bacterium]|nr:MAG: hypothetical protein DME90_05475 [Verrucomicrobiota bacterium]PYL60881.1 MAG: hypothetical protein DMF24_08895 [Verrucomicrobiota bacterium]
MRGSLARTRTQQRNFTQENTDSQNKTVRCQSEQEHRGVDLISDALPFGRLCLGMPNAIGDSIPYAMHRSRLHPDMIRVYNAAGALIENARAHGQVRRVISGVGWRASLIV